MPTSTFASGATTPGGSTTQVQFNDAGTFGGDSGLTFNPTLDSYSLGRLSLVSSTTVGAGMSGLVVDTTIGDVAHSYINGIYVSTQTPFTGVGTQNIDGLIGVGAQAGTYLNSPRVTDAVYGVLFGAGNYGTGTATLVSAVRGEIYDASGGTTTTGVALDGAVFTSGSTFVDLYGARVTWSISGTTITNIRGLSIGDLSAVTVSGVKQAINYADKFIVNSAGDVVLGTGVALKTDTTTAHTALLQAYDVDGTAYKTFATLTNGNTPDFSIVPPAGGTVTVQATTFKSSDGSTGATGNGTVISAITVKNGLVTAITVA